MLLAEQWREIELSLPEGWQEARLSLETESPGDLPDAAAVLGSISAGRVGDTLVFRVGRAGGVPGPEAVRRLLGRLDERRIWSTLELQDVRAADTGAAAPARREPAIAESWNAALAPLPPDWSDLLGELELDSSDYLDRAALLCAPVNPTRDSTKLAFVFRCARRAGYGVSPLMARRCFERLDAEGITGSTRVLRVLSQTDNVSTQGPVWYVDGRVL